MQSNQNSTLLLQNPFQQSFSSTTATYSANDVVAPPQQDERTAKPRKRKRKRATDSNAAAPTATAGPSSSQDTLNIDTLVTVLDADINGTNGEATTTVSEPSTHPVQSWSHTEASNLTGGKKPGDFKFKCAKAGCITCRIRRIKCDEAHPSCVNCTKGHRDCTYPAPFIENKNHKRTKKARGER
ncbi:uncharacterized protein K452DRAFT_152909 [Aplosporella prunicola CBS 121167]|uniref:Zn(2)-C6 fungal-type domain-containing protein n=1 Tax=Aplosporella prunicola CBS 121167 TaxID=1176127 RepID=A0A6A6BIY2_9PEZI|nr:uncharacterized protein K452DRAFT_152909 [Aplosporella prunicola CBS 121167]KAF2144089.1 hypothetical protein K452DRAFT_152909 [Aplosporella prunicola CBS 121167]